MSSKRFNAIHVDREAYLLEVCRYVDLNPVRAGIARAPQDWAWSSYRAHIGIVPAPPWLATTELHSALTGQSSRSVVQVEAARQRYAEWVESGREVRLREKALRHKHYLGDQAFVLRTRRQAE